MIDWSGVRFVLAGSASAFAWAGLLSAAVIFLPLWLATPAVVLGFFVLVLALCSPLPNRLIRWAKKGEAAYMAAPYMTAGPEDPYAAARKNVARAFAVPPAMLGERPEPGTREQAARERLAYIAALEIDPPIEDRDACTVVAADCLYGLGLRRKPTASSLRCRDPRTPRVATPTSRGW